MAQPTNSFSSYDSVGNREDLANIIYNVDPSETPFLSDIPTAKAESTLHEWQTDSLAAPNDSNWVIEGDDATTDAAAATTRLNNQCGISDKVVRVTGTQEAVKKAGRGKEMAYQMVKRGKELKTDIEKAMFANNAKVAGNDTTAREVAGIESWINTNTSAGTGGSDPTGNGTDARTDGTQRAFTEALLLGVHQSCWENGGTPNKLYVGPFNKRTASGFIDGNDRRTISAEKKKIVQAVDIYVSDFGQLEVVASRHVRSRSAILVQSDMWAYATLRNMKRVNLAKTGDTERKQLICEWTMESRNEKASGGVFDLTTS